MNTIELTGLEISPPLELPYQVYYSGDNNISGVASHTHPFFEFYLFCNGDIDYFVGTQSFHLKYGNLLIIPPNTPHHAKTNDISVPYRRYVLWVTGDLIDELIREDADMYTFIDYMKKSYSYNILISASDMLLLTNILTNILEEMYVKNFGYRTNCNIHAKGFFLKLNQILKHHESNDLVQKREIHLDIIKYIKNNLDQDLSLELLANKFFISKFHMSRLFKENMHISIYKYISLTRLGLATSHLLSGTPISTIHSYCGYKDYATFYRAFKNRTGLSPRQFRKKHKETPPLS